MKVEMCWQYCRSPRNFSAARSAYCLTHFFIDDDPLSETAAADNLLFWGRGFFKRNAAFAVKFSHSPFQNDVKVITDKCWVGQ